MLAQYQPVRELCASGVITISFGCSHISSCSKVQCLSSITPFFNGKKAAFKQCQNLIFYANIFRKKHHFFQRGILGKKKGWRLFALVQWLFSILCLSKYASQGKEKLHHFFMKRRVFPLELKLLPTALCFVSWRGRHIIQELGTHFQKGEKTDRVDSPSRKEILKVSNVGDTPDRRITFL